MIRRAYSVLSWTLIACSANSVADLASDAFIELRNGLTNSGYAFEQGQCRVAFLGGSITQMRGWRELVCEDLQARFRETDFDFVQAGVASMGSTPGAFRLGRDVFGRGKVDLLFVEAAVNDSTNGRTTVEQIRGMEGIVRHARRRNPAIDIVFLYFVDPDKLAAYGRNEVPEVIAAHDSVAQHYMVPSIDLAREVYERIAADEFTWEDDFKNLHPSPFGHKIYQRSIARLFDMAWHEPPLGPTPHTMPAKPLDSLSYANGKIEPLESAEALNGFRVVEGWTPSDGAGTRPGFTDVRMLISESPGDSFVFRFTGSAVGLWVAAGPDAGVISCTVDGKPSQQIDLYTQWSAGLHLPWAYIVAGDLPAGEHVLRVENSTPNASRDHGRTAVRIAHFLVNAPPGP